MESWVLLSGGDTNLQTGNADEAEFAKRAKIADLMLKEKDIQSNERIATMQMQSKQNARQIVKSVV